jgi:hypothetical protein
MLRQFLAELRSCRAGVQSLDGSNGAALIETACPILLVCALAFIANLQNMGIMMSN